MPGKAQQRVTVATWMKCQSGAAAVEYSIIAFAMFGAIIPAFFYVSSAMGIKFSDITAYFDFS